MTKRLLAAVVLLALSACAAEQDSVWSFATVGEDVRTRVVARPADEVFAACKTLLEQMGLTLVVADEGHRRLESDWMRRPLGRLGEVTAWLRDPDPPRCVFVSCQIGRKSGSAARVTWQISADRVGQFGAGVVADAGRAYYEAFWCILARRLSKVKLAAEFGGDALLAPPRVLHASETDAPGLIAGDLLIAADHQPLPNLFALLQILLTKKPGDALALSVERVEGPAEVTLTLSENDDPNLIPLATLPVPQRHTLQPEDRSLEPNLEDLPIE